MARHGSMSSLPSTLGHTGPQGQCGRVPRHSFLGTGTGPSVSQLRLVLEHDGSAEVAGWLVSVTAAVDPQNACLLLLLLTVEGSDGALSVLRKWLGKTTNAFSQPLRLPFICFALTVCAEMEPMCCSKGLCSGNALGDCWQSQSFGSSAFEERYLSCEDALPHLMWYTATRIWNGSRGSPILSLERRHSLS